MGLLKRVFLAVKPRNNFFQDDVLRVSSMLTDL